MKNKYFKYLFVLLLLGVGFKAMINPSKQPIEGCWQTKSSEPENTLIEIDKDIYGVYEIQIWQTQDDKKKLKSISRDVQFEHPNLSFGLGIRNSGYGRLKLDSTANHLDGRLIYPDGSWKKWCLERVENIN
jgi:hypothetical protein